MKELYNHCIETDLYIPENKQGIIVSSARNNTLIHEKAFQSLLNYSEFKDYPLLIGAERYHNPNKLEEYIQYEENIWWDERLNPYIFDERLEFFNGRIVLSGHIRQTATNENPLRVFDKKQEGDLNILPNAKFHCLPRYRPVFERYPKFNCTTGTLTPCGYSFSSAGYKAQQEEQLGFVIIYKRDDGFFAFRQIEIDNEGCFHDIDYYVTPTDVIENKKIPLIYAFDLHIEEARKEILSDFNTLLGEQEVEEIVIGDLVSWQYSHHKDILDHALKQESYNLYDCFEKLLEWRKDFLPKDLKVIIPHSNHHDHIEKFINTVLSKGLKDSSLWKDFIELAKLKFDYPDQSVLQSAMEHFYHPPLQKWNWLSRGDHYSPNGVINDQHGDKGLSGGKGGPTAYRKLGRKINHGHGHSGYRLGLTMGSGVSCFPEDMDYAFNGFTNWTNTVIAEYNDGSRYLLHWIEGAWK